MPEAFPNKWLICEKAREAAALRLFCFSYAGGGASAYRGWADGLPSSVEVYWIQLPGRENRLSEPLYTSLAELAPGIADNILNALDRPFAFYGHSLGGKIAFETLHELRTAGHYPSAFFAGASPAPHLPWLHPSMHELPEKKLLDEIQKRYGGVPGQVAEDPELRALLIPTLRADLRLTETSLPRRASIDCPLTVFGGTNDPTVSVEELEAWRCQTNGPFRRHMIPGDHFFLRGARGTLLGLIEAELRIAGLIP